MGVAKLLKRHPCIIACENLQERGVRKVKKVRFLNLEQFASFEQLTLGVSGREEIILS